MELAGVGNEWGERVMQLNRSKNRKNRKGKSAVCGERLRIKERSVSSKLKDIMCKKMSFTWMASRHGRWKDVKSGERES